MSIWQGGILLPSLKIGNVEYGGVVVDKLEHVELGDEAVVVLGLSPQTLPVS